MSDLLVFHWYQVLWWGSDFFYRVFTFSRGMACKLLKSYLNRWNFWKRAKNRIIQNIFSVSVFKCDWSNYMTILLSLYGWSDYLFEDKRVIIVTYRQFPSCVCPLVLRIGSQHQLACRRRQTKRGDTLAVCCDPWWWRKLKTLLWSLLRVDGRSNRSDSINRMATSSPLTEIANAFRMCSCCSLGNMLYV